MPAKFEGPLDEKRLEDVNLNPTSWKPIRTPRWSIDMVRPEFLALRRSSSPKKPIRKTAWLDGLRGVAAFTVYIHHHQLWAHELSGMKVLENAFAYEGMHYFAAFPFIRNFFAGGHFAVAIFFIISGYVLSLKSLNLIQQGRFLNSADSLGSALFRRWLRLYIPVFAVAFVWMTQGHWFGIWVDGVKITNTYREDIIQFYQRFKNYSFVFNGGDGFDFTDQYHKHAWTIPYEFRGSIIVFTTLSALARCTRNARLWCQVGLIFYFLYIADGFFGAMFIAGMLLCDLDLLAEDDNLPRFLAMFDGFKELIYFHLFVIGMYLGGVPSDDGQDKETLLSRSPGWRWLSHFKPQAVFSPKWFYLFWAALFMVASVPRLPWLKHFFESRFCQYLARISFALYLVHGYVLMLLGDRIYAAVGWQREGHKDGVPGWIGVFPISKKGPLGLEPAFWIPQLILVPVTFYVAEMVTKMIDGPSVKFSSWLYKKATEPPSSPK